MNDLGPELSLAWPFPTARLRVSPKLAITVPAVCRTALCLRQESEQRKSQNITDISSQRMDEPELEHMIVAVLFVIMMYLVFGTSSSSSKPRRVHYDFGN